jgi:hypothetical protein
LIDGYARQTESFLKAVADGVIDQREIKEQEKTLVSLMKQVEPLLNDELHAIVTRLLCELTLYDIMHVMAAIQDTRSATKFRG